MGSGEAEAETAGSEDALGVDWSEPVEEQPANANETVTIAAAYVRFRFVMIYSGYGHYPSTSKLRIKANCADWGVTTVPTVAPSVPPCMNQGERA
jgi:hypothetical protein